VTGPGSDTSPDEKGPIASFHHDRARASSFGDNAELYDATRPGYPAQLVSDLVARGGATVLDVGCGTGLLGRGFLAHGLAVTGVEPDARMAAVATRAGLIVEVATFEEWEPEGRTFDLLVSGQAWHWVDPVIGAQRAADVIAPGGSLALVWNDGTMDGELRASLDDAYDELAAGIATPTVLHRSDDWLRPGGSQHALMAVGAFKELEVVTYEWSRTYTTAQWVSQLETHSDHALMEPDARAALLAAVARVIDGRGGSFTMRYDCRATLGERR
jgi:SAM-dependent methyltransferase